MSMAWICCKKYGLFFFWACPLYGVHFTPTSTVLQTKSLSAQYPLSKNYCTTCKILVYTVSAPQHLLYYKQNPPLHSILSPNFTVLQTKSTSAKAQSSISGLITPHHGASQAVKGAKHRMRYALDSLLDHDTLLINQRCPTNQPWYPSNQPEMPHNFVSKHQKRTSYPSIKKGPRKRGPQKQLNLYSWNAYGFHLFSLVSPPASVHPS